MSENSTIKNSTKNLNIDYPASGVPGSISAFGLFRLETSTMGLEMGMSSGSLTVAIMHYLNSLTK